MRVTFNYLKPGLKTSPSPSHTWPLPRPSPCPRTSPSGRYHPPGAGGAARRDPLNLRVFSIAAGEVRIKMDFEDEFVLGTHGTCKLKPVRALTVTNVLYTAAVLHVTAKRAY
ncbi:hypothetical protein V8F20_003324 [Naviculisporaceae sp. PSN 640]